MNIHLSLKGKWVECKATRRACPRVYHLQDTTPRQAELMPPAFMRQLLQFQDPPTEVAADGTLQWRKRSTGMFHRDHDLPAVIHPEGTKIWYQDGYEHRADDKPSYVHVDGTLRWAQWGNRHRDGDKPAVVRPNGRMSWYQDDKLHRLNGPAAVYEDGTEEYYWEGYKVSKRSHSQMVKEYQAMLAEKPGQKPETIEIARRTSEDLF